MKKQVSLWFLMLLCLVACSKTTRPSQPKASAPSSSSSSAIAQKTDGALTPDEVAASEGNHAEQVVVEITADGYVTSHGDHYHFYHGKVGYEALLSRDLVTEGDYVFDPNQVVADVADGHIVKVGEDYHLYLTTDQPINLR